MYGSVEAMAREGLVETLREGSRSGSHSGRGFRYQDAVATHAAILIQAGKLSFRAVVPEGLDDISLEGLSSSLHCQVKSSRRPFSTPAIARFLTRLWSAKHELVRDTANRNDELALVIELAQMDIEPDSWHTRLAGSLSAKSSFGVS